MLKHLFIKSEQVRQEKIAQQIQDSGRQEFRTRLRENKAYFEAGRRVLTVPSSRKPCLRYHWVRGCWIDINAKAAAGKE